MNVYCFSAFFFVPFVLFCGKFCCFFISVSSESSVAYFKKQSHFSFVLFVSILFYTKGLCDLCAFLRLPKTKPIKPNFPLCLLFLFCFIQRVYVTSVPFRGNKKQSQSKPIWGGRCSFQNAWIRYNSPFKLFCNGY